MEDSIREPKQQRAIDKKDKIIDLGFQLICENGYYNINTAEIAKAAGVSTGIVYQYFKDKYDIFMEGLHKYGDEIFFPLLIIDSKKYDFQDLERTLQKFIHQYIYNHKVSQTAHEEITSMIHSNPEVANYFYERELQLTEYLTTVFLENQYDANFLREKVHIMIGMIDNLCHEVIYHKHEHMNYNAMTDIVIHNILSLFQ